MSNENGATGRKGRTVVVAMSGGVDSSVAATLLVQKGYDVIGMMMRLWSEPGAAGSPVGNRCCTPDQMHDARRIADHLGIPFYTIDVQSQFRQHIVQYFIDEHAAGRTPNPCIECNRQIRFSFLLDHALALGADYLATGHYARVRKVEDLFQLLQGEDENKDQSYVLYTLNQEKLAHVLFPVGDYLKSEVRKLAAGFGLPVAGKQDSQDLCFLADGDYRRFLREYSTTAITAGPIIAEDGHELGRHNGLPFYTIGQRKKLGISSSIPLHVLGKDNERNALIVGPREKLGRRTLVARDVNWISGSPPEPGTAVETKIRYKACPVAGTVADRGTGQASVAFAEPVYGVTPGQGVVFYQKEACLGGGIIEDTLAPEWPGRSPEHRTEIV